MNEIGVGKDVRSQTCFVIGPIGNRHAAAGSEERLVYEEALQVYEDVIEAACDAVGLSPVRADGLMRAGEITEQIFRRLRDDDVVIADLTGANPNVMYELGLRHTRNQVTLQIGEYGRLPFDVTVIRTVQFSRSPHGLIKARNELIALLEAALAGDADPVSATRVWNEIADPEIDPVGELVPSAREEDQEDDDDDAAGFLDVMAEGEDGWENLRTAAEEIGAVIESMGELSVRSAEEVQASDSRGEGMKARLVIVARYAKGLSGFAGSLENAVDDYEQAMAAVSAANHALLDRVEEEPEQLDDEPAKGWAATTRRLARTVRETVSSLGEMVEALNENAKVARVLREPSRRISSALNRLNRVSAVADEWDRRLQALGVPEPPDDEEEGTDESV